MLSVELELRGNRLSWSPSFRRMFPHCSVGLSGLQPFTNYIVMVDIVPVDSVKYKVDAAHTHTHTRPLLCWAAVCCRQQSAATAQPAGLLLHFKASLHFLFVRSQLEAQSISITHICSLSIQRLLHQWPFGLRYRC